MREKKPVIELSARDQVQFLEALESPPEPSPALRAAFGEPETPPDPPATPAGTYESSSAIPAMLPDSGSGSATGEAAASVPNAGDSGQPAQTGTDAGVAELIEQLRKHCKCYATMPDVCLPCEAGTALAQQATQLQDWRSWAQFVYLGGGAVTVADKALRSAVCAKHDEDVTSLRAELETAKQAREREKR